MDDLGRLLTLALGFLAIATAAGFGLQRGRIADLRERLKDNDEELERKDRRLTETEAELERHKTSSSAEIGRLKTDLDALARVVTGEAHWTAIGEKLDDHHTQAETHWTHGETVLEEIRDLLAGGAPTSTPKA